MLSRIRVILSHQAAGDVAVCTALIFGVLCAAVIYGLLLNTETVLLLMRQEPQVAK